MATTTTTEETSSSKAGPSGPCQSCVVHPIVLLSVVDHYNRVAKDTKKRVVGMLLGSVSKGVVDITNCYAVPFEEDERDLNIWYLDHSFHEQMFGMFKKVNASEKLVGWYSTGPKIKPGDLQIDQLVRRYTPNPVMVIVDVQPKDLGIPTEAYHAVEEIREGQQQQWTFKHVPSEIGAMESEEVGVEHLLRDVRDTTISTLANRVTQKLGALKGLAARLSEVGGAGSGTRTRRRLDDTPPVSSPPPLPDRRWTATCRTCSRAGCPCPTRSSTSCKTSSTCCPTSILMTSSRRSPSRRTT